MNIFGKLFLCYKDKSYVPLISRNKLVMMISQFARWSNNKVKSAIIFERFQRSHIFALLMIMKVLLGLMIEQYFDRLRSGFYFILKEAKDYVLVYKEAAISIDTIK